MRRKHICTASVGGVYTKFYVTGDCGGEFRADSGTIDIGLDEGEWVVLGTLLHEIFEMVMTFRGLRYTNHPDYSQDNGALVFWMQHHQYSECCNLAAQPFAAVAPVLLKEHKKFHKAGKIAP